MDLILSHNQVDTDAHAQTKNGKKICWNYRKGRCRFGSNCSYAHDSDLHITQDNSITEQQFTTTDTCGTNVTTTIPSNKMKTQSKKRPGLSDSIVPSKKVIKAYNSFKK